MPQTTAFSVTLSVLALTAATPALAVTAEELWAEWQTQSAAMGQVLSAASVTPGAGSLTLSGFTSSFTDGEVSSVGRIDEIVMTENADGSVTITMSDTYAFTITFVPEPGIPPVNLGLNLIAPDLVMTASGEPGARLYDYSASRITIEDGPISGGDGPPPTIDLNIGIVDFAATYQIDGTDPANIGYASTTTMGGIAGAADILPPPDEIGRMKLSFSVGATTASGEGRLGNFMEVASNPDLVPSGFDLNGEFVYDSARMELTFEHPSDGFSLFASNAGGSLSATFSETEIDYRVSARRSATFFAGPDLPVPIQFSVGSAEIAFAFPLVAAADPQPISARLAYQDVAVSPQIWAMADPAGNFPRDPVTVIADLTGSVQVLADLMTMDPEGMGPPPAELRDLTLNELRVSVGGATLTGTGSATFAPGPVPMPVGSVDLQLAGGLGLIDRLQATGIVPIEQLAMVRGMLGAFARPGAAPDTLESTIEFTEGGGISANGVPLQ
ncbi:DUF2125 domain-containing protein [Roseicyclus persicicus]|uniref:DUF2125 domain-containing protein n=1 Tax=Roseicyclus persicicus TaxID=2650661 RepID=A0A7X6H2H2_9RHOB|nr:DUF2125 domain-containing protein [Roseibacterium persicicum]NKX45626.1 DUF2125 domain-containing protein [Roseibacterium persicicum]